MSKILRNIERSANEKFDIIIIGGGIYGIMLALESGFRNKRTLLLERDDFGGATSFNHLRTLHGGLRYLQSMDLPRFFESVKERKWFLIHYPQLSKVLPCLMPLYGKGLHRNSILKVALFMNDLLSYKRNAFVSPERHLSNGKVISAESTKKIFPNVEYEDLKGGAIWHDGMISEHQRLLIEILRWACEMGTMALNYVSANGLLTQNNTTIGVKAIDRESGNKVDFIAPIVINATGPWSREIARNFDRDYPSLFVTRILNWNILFKRKTLSDHAIAVTPLKGVGHTYFFHNWKNRMLVGTGEEPIPDSNSNNFPTEQQIHLFIEELNLAVPELSLGMDDIEYIYSGILPGTSKGKLAKREAIIRHEDEGGPKGFFSLSGVKYTTSRLVAEKTLNLIFPETISKTSRFTTTSPRPSKNIATFSYNWMPSANDKNWLQTLKQLIEDESVMHLDDLLFRRTSLGDNSQRVLKILPQTRNLFTWTDSRWAQEIDRIIHYTSPQEED